MQGLLFIAPRPRGGDWLDDDVAAWAQEGVGVLVSLLRKDEELELGLEREAEVCATKGIEFIALPVQDLAAPIDSAAFVQSVHHLAARVRSGQNVAVHCRQSVGRSGLLAVSIAVACDLTLESAIRVVSSARGVGVPETSEQMDWLRRNALRLAGPSGRALNV